MKRGKIRDTLVYTKLTEVEESIETIRENLPTRIEDFVSMGIVKDGIYKRAEYAIENVFDICHVINADLSLGIPSNEEDVIENLKNNGILDATLSMKVISMRKFRNIVVPRYGRIDDRVAFHMLTEELDDFDAFSSRIRSVLKEST